MEFDFDSAREHGLDAIAAACGLLEGQPYVRRPLRCAQRRIVEVIANRLDLDEGADSVEPAQNAVLLIAASNRTPSSKPSSGNRPHRRPAQAKPASPTSPVEMETGTGKTYVYLRTALELYRRYGLRKFIVVVPSVAVREGVSRR